MYLDYRNPDREADRARLAGIVVRALLTVSERDLLKHCIRQWWKAQDKEASNG